jgi:3-hydroxy-9,10-secoandrosta-1,3,5(10)-triene-9,17-dione monooxygenase
MRPEMAGTGSNTVVGENVFVPEHRVLPVARQVSMDLPTERNAGNPYFHKPVVSWLIAQAAGTPVGIARGAFDAFMARLPGRGITYTTYTEQAAAPVTHLQLGEAAMKIESADAHGRRSNELVEQMTAGSVTMEQRARVRAHVAYATRLAREAVMILFEASGATAIQPSVAIQRFHRDIDALANHAFMAAPTALELYGRIICGLEPNTVFI